MDGMTNNNKEIARELRIGNIQHCAEHSIPRWGIKAAPYSAITGYGIYLVEAGHLKFEPVKLTPEVLLSMGLTEVAPWDQDYSLFKFSSWEDYYLEIDWRRSTVGCELLEKYPDQHDFYFVKAGIKYLHQLQNIVFEISGEELKVDMLKLPTNK